MTDNYSGSDLECRAGRESYDLMQKAIDQGYTVRREPGRIIISIIPATTIRPIPSTGSVDGLQPGWRTGATGDRHYWGGDYVTHLYLTGETV